MARWRKRKANIPGGERDLFERYGETAITLVLTSGHQPAASELRPVYENPQVKEHARAWLTERADVRDIHERRIEFVEWAILIFVGISVLVELRWLPSWIYGTLPAP
jgi:hypothetical protein